jgi:hypothetical protein
MAGHNQWSKVKNINTKVVAIMDQIFGRCR